MPVMDDFDVEMSDELVDALLREAGLDPEKVGHQGNIVAHAAMLQRLLNECPWRDPRYGYCTNERNRSPACHAWACPFCKALREGSGGR